MPRNEDFRKFIHRELGDFQAGAPGQSNRLAWLRQHLAVYADRLAGFAAAGASLESLVRSDFFDVLDVATEVLEEELAETEPTTLIHQAGHALRAAVESFRTSSGVAELAALQNRVADVVATANSDYN